MREGVQTDMTNPIMQALNSINNAAARFLTVWWWAVIGAATILMLAVIFWIFIAGAGR